jgi:hypothetical protein
MKIIYSTLKGASFFPWIQGNLNKQVHLLFFLKKVVPVHAMMALSGEGTGPFTVNIGWKCQPHTPVTCLLERKKNRRYPLNRRMFGLQSRSGRPSEEKNSDAPVPV